MPNDEPVFLITGASSGIGEATARAAAKAGYRLVLSARSEDRLQSLARELGGDEHAIAVCCDVAEWGDQDSLVRWALDAYGRIDVVFANAGFGGPRGFESHEPGARRQPSGHGGRDARRLHQMRELGCSQGEHTRSSVATAGATC